MADVLEVNQMLANSYEPKRANRWVLDIDGIDAFTLKSAARPKITVGETKEINYINSIRYIRGGPAKWDAIAIELYDPISPSASQKVMEWVRLHHESLTGRDGYQSFFQKDIGLQLLDPVGAVVERWRGENGWIVDADFNTVGLDYATSDPLAVALTIQCDRWILEF